jgi:hypothetical protein
MLDTDFGISVTAHVWISFLATIVCWRNERGLGVSREGQEGTHSILLFS